MNDKTSAIEMRGIRVQQAAALISLSLPWMAQGFQNYTSVDMMNAQLALMDNRPDNCPPWCV